MNNPPPRIGEEGSVRCECVRHPSMKFILWELTVQLVSILCLCSENGAHFMGILFFNCTVSFLYSHTGSSNYQNC
jgi:hypothetical protein